MAKKNKIYNKGTVTLQFIEGPSVLLVFADQGGLKHLIGVVNSLLSGHEEESNTYYDTILQTTDWDLHGTGTGLSEDKFIKDGILVRYFEIILEDSSHELGKTASSPERDPYLVVEAASMVLSFEYINEQVYVYANKPGLAKFKEKLDNLLAADKSIYQIDLYDSKDRLSKPRFQNSDPIQKVVLKTRLEQYYSPYSIKFIPMYVEEDKNQRLTWRHSKLLYDWVQDPVVREFWGDSFDDLPDCHFYTIATKSWMAYSNDIPFAVCEIIDLSTLPARYPFDSEEYACFRANDRVNFGLSMFIKEAARGLGLSLPLIKAFVEECIANRKLFLFQYKPHRLIFNPDSHNIIAVAMLTRAGFSKIGNIQVDGKSRDIFIKDIPEKITVLQSFELPKAEGSYRFQLKNEKDNEYVSWSKKGKTRRISRQQ